MSAMVEVWVVYASKHKVTRMLAGRARTRKGVLKIALGGGETASGIGWYSMIRGTKEALTRIGAAMERDGREFRWRFYDNNKRPIGIEVVS